MPTRTVYLNSVSRTQTFNEKTEPDWGKYDLFEKVGSPYNEQQDFGAHSKCAELEDS